MSTIKRITKNMSVLFFSQIFSYILGFLTLTYSARYLGVEGFGILSLALAFTGVFTVFLELGMDSLLIREVACNHDLAKDYAANAMLLRIILALITFGIIFLILQIINYNQETIIIILIMSVYMIFNSFSQFFYAIFQAFEKMEYQAVGLILTNIILLLGIILVIQFKGSIIEFASVYVIMTSISLLYCYAICYWKLFSPSSLKWDKLKELIKEAWPFAIIGISANIYLYIDTLLLSLMQGEVVVGLYSASYRLISVLLFVPLIFSNTLYPVMSKQFNSSKEALKISFEKSLKILMMIAIPIGIGTVLIANKVILLLYGDEFLGSVIALQILIWTTVLVFTRQPFGILLAASRKQLTATKIMLIAVIFNIALNLLFIPKYSYIGAGIALILTEIFILTLGIIVTKAEFPIPNRIKIDLMKIIIASIIMGISMNYFINLNLFLVILLGFIIYCICLIFLKIIDKEETSMIKSIIK